MARLFGTDGVRGIANEYLTPELAYDIGKAAGYVLGNESKFRRVIIGRDTRLSGNLLECAVASALMSTGYDVELVGVEPTPAIAYLTRTGDYDFGIVISASHNPFEYNGIKFFNHDGYKLSDEVEDRIEEIINSDVSLYKTLPYDEIGRVIHTDAREKYKEYLKSCHDFDLEGLKIGIDAGNGALYKIAKEVLEDLNAEVIIINDSPDGTNINKSCGSTNPELIKNLVKENGLDVGFSFDGDADRIIAVDELGREIDGDHILAICATYLKSKDRLKNNIVVGTIMTNIGFARYLETIGAKLLTTKVGDRYILEELRRKGGVLGGEQSGHVIFLDYNTTGDGLGTGLFLLEAMKNMNMKMSELNDLMVSYPQVLENARVRNELKYKYEEHKEIVEKIKAIEEKLEGEGRVVIRTSGTEPVIRVMIEGQDKEVIGEYARELRALIESKLG